MTKPTEQLLRSKLAFLCMAAFAGEPGDLKTATDDLIQWFSGWHDNDQACIRDTLAEIQRLSDENANLSASCVLEQRENERLRAEVERLQQEVRDLENHILNMRDQPE